MAVFHITVPKAQCAYTIDTDKLPDASKLYGWEYGFKQAIVDATASMIRKDFVGTDAEFRAEAKKLADARFAQIQSGAVPGSRVAVDPIQLMSAQTGIPVDRLREMFAAETARAMPTESAVPAKTKKSA